MSVNLRYPNITAGSTQEQISQIKSYLHQLVEQLNYALPTIGGTSQTIDVQGTEMSFYDLRSLIMQELNDVQTKFDNLVKEFEEGYVKKTGWEPGKILATDENGNVVAVDNSQEIDDAVNLALTEAEDRGDFTPVNGVDYFTPDEVKAMSVMAASKIQFTMDEEGNLYYELLEE